jgi:small conductance mechanosensitive channel
MDNIDVAPSRILAEKLQTSVEAAIAIAPNIIAALIVLLLAWLISWAATSIAGKVMSFRRSREALRTAVRTIISLVVWLTGILIAATIALPGLSPSEAFAGVGIGSLAIGLAFRDVFENFLAGLLILIREPMRNGDYIECDDISGHVSRITIRDTYLTDTDGTLRLVPNALLLKKPVQVLTDNTERRQIAIVGVAYSTPLDSVPDIIRSAIQTCETVSQHRAIQVFAKDFSSSSVDFEVAWWAGSKPVDIRRSRDEVLRAIKRAFDDRGVQIPFPHRQLLIDDAVEIKQS